MCTCTAFCVPQPLHTRSSHSTVCYRIAVTCAMLLLAPSCLVPDITYLRPHQTHQAWLSLVCNCRITGIRPMQLPPFSYLPMQLPMQLPAVLGAARGFSCRPNSLLSNAIPPTNLQAYLCCPSVRSAGKAGTRCQHFPCTLHIPAPPLPHAAAPGPQRM